jgi:hypothetical protein
MSLNAAASRPPISANKATLCDRKDIMSRQNGEQEQSYFAEQRDILVQEIGLVSMTSIHQNCNSLTHCSSRT